jgi:hypothetical protein
LTKRTLGIFAGVVSSAFGAWWWSRLRPARSGRQLTPARERGTVIYDNTPAATETGVV